jgi:hypothetical protein
MTYRYRTGADVYQMYGTEFSNPHRIIYLPTSRNGMTRVWLPAYVTDLPTILRPASQLSSLEII